MNINETPILEEQERGCGFRKPRGMYLIQRETPMRPCGKFPLRLERCPTCDCGIKYSRGFTWINPQPLFADAVCADVRLTPERWCVDCAVADHNINEAVGKRAGLLWIGKQHYKTPKEWLDEAAEMGVSRRIRTVPKAFKVGVHWVFVAHIKGLIIPGDSDGTPGKIVPAIIQAFKPECVEYVCEGNETDDELDALVKRGIKPVRVKPIKGGPETPAPPVPVPWDDEQPPF